MNMSLKDFRKSYGQNLSLAVCHNAYIYFQNGHHPKPGIGTASVIYAKDFIDNPLRIMGYRVKEESGCIKIYGLLTETVGAQKALQNGDWDYDDRYKCIAGLGENYLQILIKSLQFSDDSIVSIYNHQGQYIAVVALKGCTKPSQVEDFKHIGHVVAVNSLMHYDHYLDNASLADRIEMSSESCCPGVCMKTQSFDVINEIFQPKEENLFNYLQLKSRQLGVDIHLSDICLFGNFENL